MSNYPHPADFMSDAQYEAFREAGGISDAGIRAELLNITLDVTDEILVEHFSGHYDDLTDAVKRHVTEADVADLNGGDWLTIVDGELVEAGEFMPHTLHVKLHR